MDYVNIFFQAAFIDNMIFTFFFGMCSIFADKKLLKTQVVLEEELFFYLELLLL